MGLGRTKSAAAFIQNMTGTLHSGREALPYARPISRRQTIICQSADWAHPHDLHTQPRDHIPCPTVHYASFSVFASPRHWWHPSQSGVRITQQVSNFVQLLFSYNKTDGTTCNFCVALIRVVTNTLFLSFAQLSPSHRIMLHASPVFR